MSQAELAAALGASGHPLTFNQISRIEVGARRVDVEDLVAIARALGLPPNHLLQPPDDAEAWGRELTRSHIDLAREIVRLNQMVVTIYDDLSDSLLSVEHAKRQYQERLAAEGKDTAAASVEDRVQGSTELESIAGEYLRALWAAVQAAERHRDDLSEMGAIADERDLIEPPAADQDENYA